jgi:hypothetical protein
MGRQSSHILRPTPPRAKKWCEKIFLGNTFRYLRVKAPPVTSNSYITIHLIGTTKLRLMGVPTSEVGYTSATTGRGDHEVPKGHVVVLKEILRSKWITEQTLFPFAASTV